MSDSIFNNIRILPRDNIFLSQNVGSSGQVFYNSQTNSLQIYDGILTGGYELASEKNLIKLISQKGIATIKYLVTVAGPQESDTGNKFILNSIYRPELTFVRGYTYVFDQSNQTNLYFPNQPGGAFNQHPLNFSSDNVDGDLNDGTAYLDNVVYMLNNVEVTRAEYSSRFRLATTRSVTITITETTPDTLYYYCSSHVVMGNTITVSDPGTGSGSLDESGASIDVSDTAPSDPVNGNLWLNTNNGVLYVYQLGAWIQPSYEVPNSFVEITTSDSTSLTPTGLDTLNFREGSNVEISTDSETNTITFNVVGVSNLSLESFNVESGSVVVGGSLIYNNQTGVFTYNPPDLTSYATSTDLLDYATLESPTFTGTVSGITASMVGLENVTNESKATMFTNPTFTGLTTLQQTTEVVNLITGATGTETHNLSNGSVFYHNSIASDFIVNLTNVPITENRSISVVLILDQGATAYVPTGFQIDGVTQTVNLLDGTPLVGTTNQIDIVSYTLIRVGAVWTIIGSISTYG